MSPDERAAVLSHDEIVSLLISYDDLTQQHSNLKRSHDEQAQRLAALEQQLDWFKRQLFGAKSERRQLAVDARQMSLGELPPPEPDLPPAIEIAAHRRRCLRAEAETDDGPLRFDESVPVERIELLPDLPAGERDDWVRIGEKVTRRLAQRPSSYVVLEYVRPVFKKKAPAEAIRDTIVCLPPPEAVLERSVADVSLLAGLLLDKFLYHLPLYRQHQRLAACGVQVGRGTLSTWVHRCAELLRPLHDAQLASILASAVLAMDETPLKAGRKKRKPPDRGKMATGYLWPLYGDKDEVAFHFAPSRSHGVVDELLRDFSGTLLTDGYEGYDRFTARCTDVVHAGCWAHARRYFERALAEDASLAGEALDQIAQLYAEEARLRARSLSPEALLAGRALGCKPRVDAFFEWLKTLRQERALLPSSLITKAVAYALARENKLKVFLEQPGVALDTNHLERALRPIAVGRKNWLFCWTELGAQYVGVIQSLLSTCRLQGVNPYTYLVDVLQRIQTHPASRVAELTPRLWKERFAGAPLRSDLELSRTL